MSLGCVEFLQSRDARRHRQRIAAQRAGLIHAAKRREAVHDFHAPAERPDRQTAADDFAKARQVRSDAKPLLRATGRETKARHHFIENQQRAMLAGDAAQEFQITRLGQIQARIPRHRLHDDAGNLPAIRAGIYFRLGRFEEALAQRDLDVTAHPEDPMARYYRADRAGLGPLKGVLLKMWETDLDRLADLAEKEAKRGKR